MRRSDTLGSGRGKEIEEEGVVVRLDIVVFGLDKKKEFRMEEKMETSGGKSD